MKKQSNSWYKPSWLFRFSHINTMYPARFRKVKNPIYDRKILSTPDGDVLDIDTKFQKSDKVAILCHGLEGSSSSQYMMATTNLLYSHGWDVIAMNYRGCGGRPNLTKISYHAGKTDDLHLVIQELAIRHETISLIGYSLGGNLVLKYCSDGLYELDKRIKSVVSISAPIDLKAGAIEIIKPKNYIYNKLFISELKEKIRLKATQFPNSVDIDLLENIKTLYDFDDKFTAPMHGFGTAENYYKINSAKQYMHQIAIPCLIIAAKDDPFLSETCYPTEIAQSNTHIKLLSPDHGGHLGFYTAGGGYYWNEVQTLNFIDTSRHKM